MGGDVEVVGVGGLLAGFYGEVGGGGDHGGVVAAEFGFWEEEFQRLIFGDVTRGENLVLLAGPLDCGTVIFSGCTGLYPPKINL